MRPAEAIPICLVKSFQWKGRASRSEYWWFLPVGIALPGTLLDATPWFLSRAKAREFWMVVPAFGAACNHPLSRFRVGRRGEWVIEFDRAIEQAVRRHAPPGSPYSMLLSGGLDSRMARRTDRPSIQVIR